MKTRSINAAGLPMHLLEKGEGEVVLLVHGFPETAYAWRHQIDGLAAAGFHAIAPDMRGYGQTHAPAEVERYSIFDLVGDLVGLLDAIGQDLAILVGNDWGSTVAWQASLLRPDRFRSVAAIGVPMMGSPPVPPTAIFPRTDAAELYTLYFQEPGVAEAEFSRDVMTTLTKIYHAASREAGARRPGDDTPNPFSMVSRDDGLLAHLPQPDSLPLWLTMEDLRVFVDAFEKTGFAGGLNYYRNLDANWHMQKAFAGQGVGVPALFMVGEQDPGLAIPGMPEIIAAMQQKLVPRLTKTLFIPDCGHWAPQEQPDTVTQAIVEFARSLPH